MNTEELIHHYAKHDPIIIDENTLSKMNEIDINTPAEPNADKSLNLA